MCELADTLAAYEGSGYVVAPAGHGKTHLIAEATGRSVGRQLILTHTHAGVNALRNKMRVLCISDKCYHIDTIASWTLRLALSYSSTSNWQEERPVNNAQWNEMYEACARLLDQEFVRRIIRSSYGGLYVDEYQDCTNTQHGIILKLARDLPCRILGDPLQGIFNFGGQEPIDWKRDIEGNFELLGFLDVPHRWIRAGAGDLGDWLSTIRTLIEQNQPIDLSKDLPASVRFVRSGAQVLNQVQGNTCRYFQCDSPHTVIAIHKGSPEYKAKCHILSRGLSGRFSSIEEVEGNELFSFIRKIDSARSNTAMLIAVIDFAKKCMTSIQENLPAGTIRGEQVKIGAKTRNPEAAKKANEYLAAPNSASMVSFLLALKQTDGIKVIRADLFNRALGVLGKHALHPELLLVEAAEKYQSEFRHRGRPIGRQKLIGTTLLVKGLEFDHAIILDAASLSRKELYVALTRGARSLTIVSTSNVLNPRE